jgi:hypothetical protein
MQSASPSSSALFHLEDEDNLLVFFKPDERLIEGEKTDPRQVEPIRYNTSK